MLHTSSNANTFASTFYFFSTHKANAEKNKKSLQANAPDRADICAKLDTKTLRTERKAADNMVLPQWGVKCFYETFVHKQTAVHLLNICAKNPPLRQYSNRCRQP
jgi:hypothetical protein